MSCRRLGYDDLAGQLRMALEQFQSVGTISFSVVAMAVAVYIGLVGVGDFWLVHRLTARPMLTWITFPLLILGVCGMALWSTWAWKGGRRHANQLHIVDIDPANERVLVRSWWHGYSPRAERFDVGLRLAEAIWPAHRSVFSVCGWEGLPGKGFGGMDAVGGPRIFSSSYGSLHDRGPEGAEIQLADMPVSAWSSRGVEGYPRHTGRRLARLDPRLRFASTV